MGIITLSITEGLVDLVSGKTPDEYIEPNPEARYLLKQAKLERLKQKDILELSRRQIKKASLSEKIKLAVKSFIKMLKN